MNPMQIRRTFLHLFLAFSILFAIPAVSDAQWVERTVPIEGQVDAFGISHSCAVHDIMADPVSVQALRNYQEMRRHQPEGGLVQTLLSDAQVGDKKNFRVRNLTNNTWRTVQFELIKRDSRLLIWVEVGEFAPDKVNQQVVDALFSVMSEQTPALSWDPGMGVLDISHAVFGNPPNVDGSNTLNILITDVIDGWTPGSTSATAGFFDPVDLDINNSNSNRADIIYLNSRPTIYLDGRVNVNRPLSIAAHEYQHLIHANYGNLNTFQNEGQSEYSEILHGFPGRNPNHLSNPVEIDRYLYTWRRNSPLVLRDYERASLLHSYIAERLDLFQLGSITRSTQGFNPAYAQALSGEPITFQDLLFEFHIANFVNNTSIGDGRFGYDDVRRRSDRVTYATYTYFPGQDSGSRIRTLEYGGVEYTEWIGVRNLSLSVTGSVGNRYALLLYPYNAPGPPEVYPIQPGMHQLNADYERVVLVAAAIGSQSDTGQIQAEFDYTFTSNWQTLPVVFRNLNHAGNAVAYAELPGDPTNPNRSGIRSLAKRFSPDFSASVREVGFTLNSRDSSLIGNDNLRIVFAQGLQVGQNFRPGVRLDSLDVPISQLKRGANNIDVSNRNWSVLGGAQYFLVFIVTGNGSRVEFLLDEGTQNNTDPNYNPVRTLLYVTPPSVQTAGWYNYSDRNNLLATMRISGTWSGSMAAPAITQQPVGAGILLDAEYTLSVSATGTPTPFFQWYRDDEPVYGANEPSYTITSMTEDDAGTYTVLVSNPAGFIFSDPAIITAVFDDFVLDNNYPNPFRFQTQFSFITPEDSYITVDIFDAFGRRVERLANSELMNQGRHYFTFPEGAVRVSSGVYFYQVSAKSANGGQSWRKSGKMLLIK